MNNSTLAFSDFVFYPKINLPKMSHRLGRRFNGFYQNVQIIAFYTKPLDFNYGKDLQHPYLN